MQTNTVVGSQQCGRSTPVLGGGSNLDDGPCHGAWAACKVKLFFIRPFKWATGKEEKQDGLLYLLKEA